MCVTLGITSGADLPSKHCLMIKRILVALDTDSDTPVATQYAAEIAALYDAEVVGLAVIDTGQIEAASRGGGVGSMYYGEKLKENLTEETRQKAAELLSDFDAALKETGIPHSQAVEEGVPFRRIIEDMKYHDLLVVGRTPHFFYGHPEETTKTLARVVNETTAPTLVVGNVYQQVRRVLMAYDGSEAASRTVKYFTHLKPFGQDVQIEVLHVHQGDERESQLILGLIASYLEKHGFVVGQTSIRENGAAEQISEHARASGVDLVVAGAHSVSMLRKLAFGSTTEKLLNECPTPLFLYR